MTGLRWRSGKGRGGEGMIIQTAEKTCNWCGKKEIEVKYLVADPKSQAYICDGCAAGITADLKRIDEQQEQQLQAAENND